MNRNLVIMKHTKTFMLLAFAAFLLFACSKEEPTPEPQPSAVPQIILDTDITQSDPVHDCHSFKTLEDIVRTYVEINNHCGGLLIINDEDDGRYDAYA